MEDSLLFLIESYFKLVLYDTSEIGHCELILTISDINHAELAQK